MPLQHFSRVAANEKTGVRYLKTKQRFWRNLKSKPKLILQELVFSLTQNESEPYTSISIPQ